MLTRAALTLIAAYTRWLSPLLPPVCRYLPTCSQYAAQAIQCYGLWRGGWMSFKRVCRCHPFAAGGWDPVPSLGGEAHG